MEKTKIVKIAVSFVLATCFVVAGILDYYRGEEKRIIYSNRNEHHPVIKALFAQKVRLDEPVGKLLSSWPPSRHSKHHNFTTLYYVKNNEDEESDSCCGGYSTYIQIIAMDDKLVKAMAVEGVLAESEYVFFNEMEQAAEDDYWDSRMQFITANK
jgi:hypothetical protein